MMLRAIKFSYDENENRHTITCKKQLKWANLSVGLETIKQLKDLLWQLIPQEHKNLKQIYTNGIESKQKAAA